MAKTPNQPIAAAAVRMPRPKVEVLERSLQNPFGIPSVEVEFVEPGFVGRWVNTELKGGSQLHYAMNAGWEKAKPEYVRNPDAFQFTVSPEGYVTRGPRHLEILMYTTSEHARARQRAKTEKNMRDMRMTKQQVVQAASEKLGDEAADFLNRHTGPVGQVVDSYERIEVDETKG